MVQLPEHCGIIEGYSCFLVELAVFVNILALCRAKLLSLLKVKDSAPRVALGAAIGVFVGLTPTVGVQMAMVVLIAAIPKLKFNLPVACAMVWISNPFTMIPLYYSMYWLGVLLLNRKEMHFDRFQTMVQELIDSIKDGESLLTSAWQGLTGMFDIGIDIAIPMWIGGIVLGLVFSIPTHFIVLRLAQRHAARRARSISK